MRFRQERLSMTKKDGRQLHPLVNFHSEKSTRGLGGGFGGQAWSSCGGRVGILPLCRGFTSKEGFLCPRTRRRSEGRTSIRHATHRVLDVGQGGVGRPP